MYKFSQNRDHISTFGEIIKAMADAVALLKTLHQAFSKQLLLSSSLLFYEMKNPNYRCVRVYGTYVASKRYN